jgi:hypothetical protein
MIYDDGQSREAYVKLRNNGFYNESKLWHNSLYETFHCTLLLREKIGCGWPAGGSAGWSRYVAWCRCTVLFATELLFSAAATTGLAPLPPLSSVSCRELVKYGPRNGMDSLFPYIKKLIFLYMWPFSIYSFSQDYFVY